MRAALVLLLVPCLTAGCLDSDGDGPGGLLGDNGQQGRSEPWVVADRGFANSAAGGSMGVDFTLDQDVSQLQLAIDFGTSAYTGLRFTSPEACVGAETGAGVYPNSASWTGSCGALEAGMHTLAWTLDGGYVQGHLTITAIP